MASSPLRSKTHSHVRSISLPPISHPLIPQFNEHLSQLRTSEATSSSSSTSNRLSVLEDLYNCIHDLLLLPHTQQAFAREWNKKWVDEALDVCATTKDVFSQAKQDVQQLLSTLRRRRDVSESRRYLIASRHKAKKAIQNCSLKNLKSSRRKSTVLLLDKHQETLGIFGMLKEAEVVTLAAFESLLSYVTGTTKVQTRLSSWSLVSKVLRKNVGYGDEKTDANEFEKFESALHSLIKSDPTMCVEKMQNKLVKMESSIQNIEEELECLFRHLIKTRVSLLNILNHQLVDKNQELASSSIQNFATTHFKLRKACLILNCGRSYL